MSIFNKVKNIIKKIRNNKTPGKDNLQEFIFLLKTSSNTKKIITITG